MTVLMIVVLATFGIAALIALPFLMSHLIFRILGRTSGLNRLAELYPATGRPEGEVLRRQ
jgi:hypothetical protein